MAATATRTRTPSPPVDRVAPLPLTTTTVAWIPTREMDLDEWSRAGQRLGVMHRCSPWWIGDWIRYGNTRFGEKYLRAVKITGYDRQTLMNMVYVATHFTISRRRENLSWSHHETVASLSSEEQDRWLDQAVACRMSVADLRLELRSRHAGKRLASEAELEAQKPEEITITCPKCGHVIPLPDPPS